MLGVNSPFRPGEGVGAGPQITPRTMSAAGQGGQQQPPYLQARTPVQGIQPRPGMPQQTKPVVTPQPSAMGDTVKGQPYNAPSQGIQANPNTGQPPQAGGQTLADVYNFFKSDLQNQMKQSLANTRSDAAARGVFYGTPLTGSEADINTQYLRGLGQLQAGMFGNEQQNQLTRLALASGLTGQSMFGQPPLPGPTDFSGLGALFGNQPQQQTPAITPRVGPVGNTVPGQQGSPYGPTGLQTNPNYR